jgi:hypothetical protein
MRKFALALPVAAVLVVSAVLGSGLADALAAPAAPQPAAGGATRGSGAAERTAAPQAGDANSPEWVETLDPPDFLKPFLRSPRR